MCVCISIEVAATLEWWRQERYPLHGWNYRNYGRQVSGFLCYLVHTEKESSNSCHNFRRGKDVFFYVSRPVFEQHPSYWKPADTRTTGQPMATLMVVTVVGETEETLRVAWEGGGDTEKQSVEPTEHNDFSRSWGWRKNQKSFWSQVSTCSLKKVFSCKPQRRRQGITWILNIYLFFLHNKNSKIGSPRGWHSYSKCHQGT